MHDIIRIAPLVLAVILTINAGWMMFRLLYQRNAADDEIRWLITSLTEAINHETQDAMNAWRTLLEDDKEKLSLKSPDHRAFIRHEIYDEPDPLANAAAIAIEKGSSVRINAEEAAIALHLVLRSSK